MSGRTPFEAVQLYKAPLQQSISCFGKTVLRASGSEPGRLHNATLSDPGIELLTSAQEVLYLTFSQQFEVVGTLSGQWKVVTRLYDYALENEDGCQILGFHWHPDSLLSPVSFPHMHVYQGAGYSIREDIRRAHFRTDRIAFEDFGALLIDAFHVLPEKANARQVLSANLQRFRANRTWASLP